jgi:hypothetical protein
MPSLGYEHYDARLRRPGRSHASLPTTANVGWPSPGIPVVFPTSAPLAASGLQIRLRVPALACGFLHLSRSPCSCQHLAAGVASRLAKRPASAGLALTRRTRARPSSSEEDGPRDPLATRSTARAMVLQTMPAQRIAIILTCLNDVAPMGLTQSYPAYIPRLSSPQPWTRFQRAAEPRDGQRQYRHRRSICGYRVGQVSAGEQTGGRAQF